MMWQDSSLEHIDLHTTFDSPESLRTTLAEGLVRYQKSWPRRDLDMLGANSVGSELVLSHLRVSYHDYPSEAGHVALSLDYRRQESIGGALKSKRGSLQSKYRVIEAIMQVIHGLSVECDIHCTLSWQFSAETVSPIVQLPMLRVSVPGTSFGQISGVRFTPSDADEHQYVVIDLIDKNTLHLSSHFVLSGILSDDILKKAIEYGTHLKDAFAKSASREET